jgi:hypothetical protein
MSRLLTLGLGLLVALGCSRTAPPPVPQVQVDPPPAVVSPPDDGRIRPPFLVSHVTRRKALDNGGSYLLRRQSPDGAWRSDVYATFKDGTGLTPLAVAALQEWYDTAAPAAAPTDTAGTEAAIKKGCAFLATFVKDGTVAPPADGFDYPVYTAALALRAFSHPTAKEFAGHRAAWVKYLTERQLTEPLGWRPDEKQYGGWGYCRVVPKKPAPNTFGPTLIESNLSATLFALEGLRAAGATDPEVYRAAAVFVRRCQNWKPPERGSADPPGPGADGGFHFIYDDPTRNKAGQVPDAPGVFHSYGSTTADGFRALALCDDPADADRRAAARDWLLTRFAADRHPGAYVPAHEPTREGVYYYHAAGVARAFREHELKLPGGRDWAAELSDELAKRQAPDGSWANPVELVRENDPLVATSNAVVALARCARW